MKYCAGCQRDLPVLEFRVITNKRLGTSQLSWRCYQCLRDYDTLKARVRRAREPEKYRASARASMRKWNKANPIEHRRRAKQWHIANPDKVAIKARNAKAKRKLVPGIISQSDWKDRLLEFNGYCAYCLQPCDKPEMEHMQAVSRGGTNTIDNVIPSCSPCNRTKHTKSLLEFARESTVL